MGTVGRGHPPCGLPAMSLQLHLVGNCSASVTETLVRRNVYDTCCFMGGLQDIAGCRQRLPVVPSVPRRNALPKMANRKFPLLHVGAHYGQLGCDCGWVENQVQNDDCGNGGNHDFCQDGRRDNINQGCECANARQGKRSANCISPVSVPRPQRVEVPGRLGYLQEAVPNLLSGMVGNHATLVPCGAGLSIRGQVREGQALPLILEA